MPHICPVALSYETEIGSFNGEEGRGAGAVRFDFGMVDTGAVAWVLASSALVLLMTPGVAFLYGGMARAKNMLSMIMQSYVVIALVSVLWVLIAYSLAFGGGSPVVGDLHFVGLSHMNEVVPGFTGKNKMVIPPLLYAVFQMMFAVITPALLTGSAAERWRFGSFVPFMAAWSILVYAPVAHWVFSPVGWANRAGALDFAGGTVVHANSGAAGLAMAMVLGRRQGTDTRPHSLPFTLLGAALLWFGWFGFNAGSALQANELAVYAFVNTNTATAVAMLTWISVERWLFGKATTLGAASGAVAGLVAITPCAGYVNPIGSIFVGALAGLGCSVAVIAVSRTSFVDDAFDVVGLHLVGGVIGSLAVGLFATKTVNPQGADGLFYGGGLRQFGLQAMTVVAVVVYSAGMTFALGKLLGLILGDNRVSRNEELQGLDRSLHGESAYDFFPGISHANRPEPPGEARR
jgi:ammonium transporter, Amt family